MTVLCVDTETSIYNSGGPFDKRNKLICFSWANESGSGADTATEDNLAKLRDQLAGCTTFVCFNGKFDIHWLRNVGITLPDTCYVHDCQIAEFILSNQTWKYPSLDESCAKYGLGSKIDTIAEKYWKNGIQTEDIPRSELLEYAKKDAELTLMLYGKQVQNMSTSQKQLLRLTCMDLMVLEEMEWNGIRFDEELAQQRATGIKEEIRGITEKLQAVYPDVPINFNSGDQLSAFLYGGTVVSEGKEHIGFFKSGAKVGQPKYKNVEIVHELPRLITPLRGSELKKAGYFTTNADTLLKLKPSKAGKEILALIQRQVRLNTLLEKTYQGLINKHTEQNWEPGYLHGQFNQVTVTTGRLSSSGPNLQNLDSAANDLFITRYDE